MKLMKFSKYRFHLISIAAFLSACSGGNSSFKSAPSNNTQGSPSSSAPNPLSFPLSYTDPFPQAASLGLPIQSSSSILINEAIASVSKSTPYTIPIPGLLEVGLSQITIEFWMKLPTDSNCSGNNFDTAGIIRGPGFEVSTDLYNCGNIIFYYSQALSGSYMNTFQVNISIPMSDGNWHYFASTYDSRNA